MRLDGSPSEESEITVLNLLRRLYPTTRFLHDSFLLIDRETYEATAIMQLTYDDKKWIDKSIMHHPDIIALTPQGTIAYIVEIDGSIHTNKRPGRRQTERRNADYATAGIPCIVVPRAEVEDGHDEFAGWLKGRVNALLATDIGTTQ